MRSDAPVSSWVPSCFLSRSLLGDPDGSLHAAVVMARTGETNVCGPKVWEECLENEAAAMIEEEEEDDDDEERADKADEEEEDEGDEEVIALQDITSVPFGTASEAEHVELCSSASTSDIVVIRLRGERGDGPCRL